MKNGLHLFMLIDHMHLTVESYLDQPDFINYTPVIDSLISNGFDLLREINKTLKNSPVLKEKYDRFHELQQKYLLKCHLETQNRNVKNHVQELRAEVSLENSDEEVSISNLIVKIGWNLDPKKLKILHSILTEWSYISCNYEVFEQCFWGTGKLIGRIRWLKKLKQLARLFYVLREDEKIIFEDSTPSVLEHHFEDRKGRPIKNSTLRANPSLPLSFEFEEKIKRIVWLLRQP